MRYPLSASTAAAALLLPLAQLFPQTLPLSFPPSTSSSAALPASGTSSAGPHTLSWKPHEAALLATYLAGLWVDAAQTREAMRRGYYETNPLLRALGGDVPSPTAINLYGLGAAAAGTAGAAVLPHAWRTALLAALTALQAKTITHTAKLGVGIRF